MTTMPAVFFGHGSPMNALESNRYSEAWRRFGASVPRPRAIVVVSAHWMVPFTAVTAMPWPRTIHDFFGFPEALFEVQYPAPGDPELAAELREIARPTRVGLDRDMWGIDHGTWSVLVHAFPQADIPVLQLAIDSRTDFEHHVELGARRLCTTLPLPTRRTPRSRSGASRAPSSTWCAKSARESMASCSTGMSASGKACTSTDQVP